MSPQLELTVSEFVAVFNQTLDIAYPTISIIGELANFRISKNRWLYFDLRDDEAIVRFFGSVNDLPGPLEDGMLLKVVGRPRLHPLYGFSILVQAIRPSGEGSIKKAARLLQAKLEAEGLFEAGRKRSLPYPPRRIGLITSSEAAAFSDFIKVLKSRWGGLEIVFVNVAVQGEQAEPQIIQAIERLNRLALPLDVLVITRGGGSADDLQVFNTENVTRAIAASRTPTLVAIGHERDISLAELAADQRASTPSNAAELLVPDRREQLLWLKEERRSLAHSLNTMFLSCRTALDTQYQLLRDSWQRLIETGRERLVFRKEIVQAFNPQAVLQRGYVIVRNKNSQVMPKVQLLRAGEHVSLQFYDGEAAANITSTSRPKGIQ